MEKNWLIRTKNNHILGPVTKDKIKELFQNGTLKPDDEITSGNGYWFFTKEKDLVERFVFGEELQTFNPVSEASDPEDPVASSTMGELQLETSGDDSEEDLKQDSQTQVIDLNNIQLEGAEDSEQKKN